MSFANAITKDRGQPANVRVGIVASVSPLLIDVQGTPFQEVGVIGSYTPQLGDVVALLGQSAVSPDASTWLVLGHIGDSPTSETSVDNGAPVVTNSTPFVASGGGGAAIGVAFTAPATGRCLVLWNVEITPAAVAGYALATPQVASGATIGAGTVHPGWAASLDRTIRNDGLNQAVRAGASDLCEGLTPGASYNVTLYYSTSGLTANFARRSVAVVPAP